MQSQTPSTSALPSRERDAGLDQLRGLAIIAVLVLHLAPITFTTASSHPMWRAAALVVVLCYEACRLAVPVFLLVSLILYVQRSNGRPGYLAKRLRRLLVVLGTWMVVCASLGVAVHVQAPITGLRSALAFPFTSGALYFLTDLLALTLITALLVKVRPRLGDRMRGLLLAGLLVSVVVLCIAEATVWNPPFWSLVGFLPYPFAALLVVDGRLDMRVAAIGFVLAVGFEAYLFLQGGLELAELSTLGYSRPTVFFGAVVAYLFWTGGSRRRQPLLEWLGLNTLGIYLIHPLVIGLLGLVGVTPLVMQGEWGRLSVSALLVGLTLIPTLALQRLLSRSRARSLVV